MMPMKEPVMPDLLKQASEPFSALIGVAPLMRRAFYQEDLKPLGAVLLERAQNHPDDANAYLDCSTVLQLIGHRDTALAMQAQAIAIQNLYSLPANQQAPGLRLLAIMGPGDLMANTPLEFLLEESDVAVDLLFVTPDTDFPEMVPDHDVMMVAIAESDQNQALLAMMQPIAANWPRPVLNLPEHIAVLSRDGVCAALKGIAGVDMPLTIRCQRADLQSLATAELALQALLPDDDFPLIFPLIVRPLGSHAGHDLDKINDRIELAAYLERVEGEQFYLSRFVDYRGSDGLFRKYRLAMIDGRAYVCHFAVSSHWMVHYLNAGMNESAEKRAEEAACMANFEHEFAARHATAIQAICQHLQLPYFGLDCAETLSGDLLIFEGDNAMIVHAMDPEDLYPYKKPAMQKVFTAFRALLEKLRQPE